MSRARELFARGLVARQLATRLVQTAIFLGGLLLLVLVDRLAAPGLTGQIMILAPAVALLGLPHGALDRPMAEALWPLSRTRDRVRFVSFYLGLAALVAALWWLVPALALAAFLAYSALHFAGDWEGEGRLVRVAGGVSAIGAPALFHTAEVAALFALLGPEEAAPAIAQGLAGAGALGGGLLLLSATRPGGRERAMAEQAGIWLGAALLPPLLYFVAYFCLLHSLRHFVDTYAALPDRAAARRAAVRVTAVTIAGAALALAALLLVGGTARETGLAAMGAELDPEKHFAGSVDAAGLKVVFIGLAALTVPHMLLVERFRRRAATPA
jgi:Brp/Blh family beta-carotene 15,15'-monooxygenase